MSRNFTDELKHQWNHGGMHIKLIGINLIVFIFIRLFIGLGSTIAPSQKYFLRDLVNEIFVLHGDINGLITHPWGLFTSIFAHIDGMHMLFNMLFLYFSSQMFLQFFSGKRLLYVYIVGGLFGGLMQVLAHQLFPGLQSESIYTVGASGSIMAIFLSLAFYRPNATVNLFGILPVKMILLGGIFIVKDLIAIGSDDGIAHFAHLGGALLGYLSVLNIHSPKNIINWVEAKVEKLKNGQFASKKSKTKMKVVKNKQYNTKSDEDYNAFKKVQQEQVDEILTKIKKAGYDSLTKREKEILFEYSRNVK